MHPDEFFQLLQLVCRNELLLLYESKLYQPIVTKMIDERQFYVVVKATFICRYHIFFGHSDNFFIEKSISHSVPDSANCLNNSFCFSLSRVGSFTCQVTNRSPNSPSFLYTGKPFPFRRIVLPFCVPGFTFNFI